MATNSPTTSASWAKLVAVRAVQLLVFVGFVAISAPNPNVQPWLWTTWVAVTGLYLVVLLATAVLLRR